jgi:hypothetical protein
MSKATFLLTPICIIFIFAGVFLTYHAPMDMHRAFYVDENALQHFYLTTTVVVDAQLNAQGTIRQQIENATLNAVQSYRFKDRLDVFIVQALRGDGLNALCFVMPYSNTAEAATIAAFASELNQANYLSKDIIIVTYLRDRDQTLKDEGNMLEAWLRCYVGDDVCLEDASPLFYRTGRISEAFVFDVAQPFNVFSIRPGISFQF